MPPSLCSELAEVYLIGFFKLLQFPGLAERNQTDTSSAQDFGVANSILGS